MVVSISDNHGSVEKIFVVVASLFKESSCRKICVMVLIPGPKTCPSRVLPGLLRLMDPSRCALDSG